MQTDARAPFTDEQVLALNKFQAGGWFHPFTCGRRSEHRDNEGILIARNDGWHCPACDYTQDWAHWFMADTQWVDERDAAHKAQWAGWLMEEC